ncbi:MAG: 16S rRNA (cytidine(1402)-2'-O)-methyltransferase [Deltaproteobacteria bacterium]|nr:16S rRNA (cytidine(1402)-2'-O)-methyltransferase [Deltaproteobacteria bacterium]
MTANVGRLWLVATPIGNRGDLPPRAVEVLGECDLIAAEDTRHSGRFLASFGIRKPMISYFEGNEIDRAESLIERCLAGRTIGLISSAGHPAISDPGYRIVDAAHRAGVEVRVVPGACAAVSALAVSGLPSDEFTFLGFIPREGVKRSEIWRRMATGGTFVLYESANRLVRTLEHLREHLADPVACVARELTKLHEEARRARASDLATEYASRDVPGEIALVVHVETPRRERATDADLAEKLRKLRERTQLSDRDLADAAAILCGIPRKDAYRVVTESRIDDESES